MRPAAALCVAGDIESRCAFTQSNAEKGDVNMATESIQVSGVINAPPDRIYSAWLDSTEHSLFTGGKAAVEPGVGGRFTAWDGYIQGTNLELEAGRRILQAWRSTEFPAGSGDSRLEVLLEPVEGGTRMTLIHTEIPEGLAANLEQGWREHYLSPMAKYFGAPGGVESVEDEDLDEMEEAPVIA